MKRAAQLGYWERRRWAGVRRALWERLLRSGPSLQELARLMGCHTGSGRESEEWVGDGDGSTLAALAFREVWCVILEKEKERE